MPAPSSREGSRFRERLASEVADSVVAQRDLALSHYKLALHAQRANDLRLLHDESQKGLAIIGRAQDRGLNLGPGMDEAAAMMSGFLEATALFVPLLAGFPRGSAGEHIVVADGFVNAALDFELAGDWSGAESAHRRALEVRERALAAEPANPERQRDVARSIECLANVAHHQPNLDAVLESLATVQAHSERLVATDPANVQWLHNWVGYLARTGEVLEHTEDWAAAADVHRREATVRERLSAATGRDAEVEQQLSTCYGRVAVCCRRGGDVDSARAWFAKALLVRERLAAHEPNDSARLKDVLLAHLTLAGLAQIVGDAEQLAIQLGGCEAVLSSMRAQSMDIDEELERDYERLRSATARERKAPPPDRSTPADPATVPIRSSLLRGGRRPNRRLGFAGHQPIPGRSAPASLGTFPSAPNRGDRSARSQGRGTRVALQGRRGPGVLSPGPRTRRTRVGLRTRRPRLPPVCLHPAHSYRRSARREGRPCRGTGSARARFGDCRTD